MNMHTHPAPTRELDHRTADGIDVWLLWRPQDDRALVAVWDAKTGDAFTLEVGAHQSALDVFHHPYAYAGDRPQPAPSANAYSISTDRG
jgi:hypothetical protein